MRPALSRRAVLGSAAALAARTQAAELARLQDLAARAGLRFGTDSDVIVSTAPPAYAQLVAAQCDVFAPNLGWRRVAGPVGAAEPVWEDPNIAFARQHGMQLTGGHLLWYQNLPAWFALADADQAQRAVDQHITNMVQHYNGQTFSWNVVNEEIDAAGGDVLGMRRSALVSKLGQDFIATAFHTAAAANSGALLTYNDTHLEMDNAYDGARRTALAHLLDRLQRAGAPITAVGLQSHLKLDGSRFDPALYRRFLHDIAARGLRILITEMDVSDIPVSGTIAQRDAAVAAMYKAFLDVALDEPAVAQLVVWGLSDRYTWLVATSDPSYRRADGLPARPLPYDDQFRPKPALDAIVAALRAAPARKLT